MTRLITPHIPKVLSLLVLAFIPYSVFCAEPDPMPQELVRFIKAYRVAEAGEISMKIVIQTAVLNGKTSKRFSDCISSKLTGSIFEDAALDVAREQFTSIENLRELNSFLEGSAGRKLIDQSMSWFSKTFERLLAGLQPLPPQSAQYTTQEWNDIQAFEKRPAYKDFNRFVENGLRNIKSNEKFKARFTPIRSQCSAAS